MLRCWPNLPNHHGGVHDIVMWCYIVNEEMYCIDVTMGIETSIVDTGQFWGESRKF